MPVDAPWTAAEAEAWDSQSFDTWLRVGGDEGRKWGDDHEALKAKVVEQFVAFFGQAC